MDVSEPVNSPEPHAPEATPRASVLRADANNAVAVVFFSAVVPGLVAFFLYYATLAIPLHGPDLVQFGASEALHRLVTAPEIAATVPHAPLTVYGHALNWELAGNAGGMHFGSLLLHVACAVLAFLCARRLMPAGAPDALAMIAGLLVATGPFAAEALGQISARGPMQAALFSLLTLWLVLRGAGRFSTAMLAALCYAAACASDAAATILPVALALGAVALGGLERLRRERTVHLTLVLVAVGLLTARAATGHDLLARGPLESLTAAMASLGHAVAVALLVGSASPLASTDLALGVLGLLFAGLALVALIAAAVLRSAASIGLLWMAVLPLGTALFLPAEAVLAQGASYLPAVGLALAVPVVIAQIQRPQIRLGATVFGVVMAVGGGVVGLGDLTPGADPDTHWKMVAEETKDARAWRYLAEYRLVQPVRDGEPSPQELALPALQAWHAQDAQDARAATLLGGALADTGKIEEAIPVLRAALALNPWSGPTTARLAALYEQRARTEGRDTLLRARDYYARANALGALDQAALEPYALVLAAVGDLPGAARTLKLALGDAQEGPAAAALKRFEAGAQQILAREQQLRATLSQGGDTAGIVQRAEIDFLRGRNMQSFYLLERVLRREGENAPAWSLLGLIYARMQRVDAFVREFGTHTSATPSAWEDLARRCATTGQWEAALAFMGQSPGGSVALRLATLAQELRQPQRAQEFLQRAADESPADPLPLLRLAEMAVAAKDLERAGAALAEAQRRGATEEQLQPIRAQMGTPSAAPGLPPTQRIVE